MRTLQVSDVYFPRVNGVSTSIKTLVGELEARGHPATIVAPRYEARGAEVAAGNGVVRIPARRVPNDPEDRWMSLRGVGRLDESLDARGYDLVHVHTPFVAHYGGLRLARRLGVPLVETYHTFFEEYLHHYVPLLPPILLRAVARWMARTQCRRADAVVVPSFALETVLRGYGVRAPLRVVPTGLDLAEWEGGDGARFRSRHGIAPSRPLLLFVGRLAHEKNLPFLLDALDEVRRARPDALLVMAGEGPAVPELLRRVRRLELERHVVFVGYLDRDGPLQDCYAAADIFVFASRTETQGLVLLEAMAQGVPVVSTAMLGTREVLEDGRGVVVSPEVIDEFAGRVVALLDDGPRRRRLGIEAVRWARSWSSQAMADSMLELYAEVCARGGRGGPG
jgi:glycosyltransferase involved in cell wall biosynthesis